MKKIRGHKCFKEQKIAYNFLFRDVNINNRSLEDIITSIDKYYTDQLQKYDIAVIKKCIINNYDAYVKKPFIAWSYEEIAEKLPI